MTPSSAMENPPHQPDRPPDRPADPPPAGPPAEPPAGPSPELGSEDASASSRALAAAAALAAVGAGALLFEALGGEARIRGSGYVTYLLLAASVEAACAVGFRLRRRWALLAYMSFFPLNQLILAAVASWSPFAFLLRLAVVVLGFLRLSRLK